MVYGETYNSRLQMAGITEKLNSSSVWNLGLGWVNPTTGANNGTLQSATAVTGGLTLSQTFAYDAVNRLLSANENGAWGQAYAYDAWGNMWMPASSLPAPAVGPGMPTANVYTTQTSGGTNRNVNSTYDGAGNLMVFGSVGVSYDAESRQTMAGANSYYYDGLGQRVENVLPGGTTVYAYDAFGRLIAEYSTAVVGSVCTTCYLSWDHLGSVRMVTDSGGNVKALHDYAPFGQEIPNGVSGRTGMWGVVDSVNPRFTGQVRDSESGLDYFNARYLASGVGRFMSVDPYNAGADVTNPQSWNGYGYVLGNPLGLVDPSGMVGLAPQGPPDQPPAPQPPLHPDPSDSPFWPNSIIDNWGRGSPGNAAGGGGGGFWFHPSGGSKGSNGGGFFSIFVWPSQATKKACEAGYVGNLVSKYVGGNTILSVAITGNTPTIELGAAIGALSGPTGAFVGALVGSMFGVGGNVSYVPGTGSIYVGAVAAFGVGVNGGSGFSVSAVHVPSQQNANSIANGKSFSLTYQPNPFLGSAVTKSPGSGPPVVGLSMGTKVPVSASAGYSVCLRNCGC